MKRGTKKRKKNNQRKKRNPPHHILPRSRGGSDDEFNKIYPPLDLHVQYHILFENWIQKEIIEKLRAFWRDNDKGMSRHFNKPNRKKAYKILFDNKGNNEVEEYLEVVWFNPITSSYGIFREDP